MGGLAYSIGYNYINRVVQGRHIGDVIFFQGGTAYNDAVAAAFSKILDKRIIVPPFNGVMGAVGAALLVREKVSSTGETTNFRGYDLGAVDYTLREFTCKGCTNFCSIQEFRVEEDRVYWGDKCSDRYRKRAKSKKQPVLDDLVTLRNQWLFEGYQEPSGERPVIGIPRTMYTFERFQLWQTFFRELGYDVLLSPTTNRQIVLDGYDTVVSEPCFPIKVAHGHVKHLLDENVRHVFLPNIINAENPVSRSGKLHVPLGARRCRSVIRSAPYFQQYEDRTSPPRCTFGTASRRSPASCTNIPGRRLQAAPEGRARRPDQGLRGPELVHRADPDCRPDRHQTPAGDRRDRHHPARAPVQRERPPA